MAEFEINGHNYRSTKLNAFTSFHVVRKLGPLLGKIGPSFANKPENLDDLAEKLTPALEALSTMPEEDCNYVLERCLGAVQRQQGALWSDVWHKSANRMMFEDIDMAEMLQISMKVLGDNLASFTQGLPQASSVVVPQQLSGQSNGSAYQTGKTG